MISFAQYAALSSASSSDHNLGQLLHLLRAVPGWSVEPTLGSQGGLVTLCCSRRSRQLTHTRAAASQDYAPSDILAHALLHAALTLVFSTTSRDSLTASRRTETIQALAQFQKDIVEEIERAEEGTFALSSVGCLLNNAVADALDIRTQATASSHISFRRSTVHVAQCLPTLQPLPSHSQTQLRRT